MSGDTLNFFWTKTTFALFYACPCTPSTGKEEAIVLVLLHG